jgi:hypothetical protein
MAVGLLIRRTALNLVDLPDVPSHPKGGAMGERPMLYPPVGIAHVAESLADFTVGCRGLPPIERIVVGSAAQPNSAPHLGTLTTTFCAFAIGQLLSGRHGVPATVLFDTLDNAPAPDADGNGGNSFHLSLDSVPAPDERGTLADYYFRSFERMLDWAQHASGVAWERRSYHAFQASAAIRRRVLAMAGDVERFGRIANPSSGRLHLRIRCPECGLLDKPTASTAIRSNGALLTISSTCPHHGDYESPLDLSRPAFLDLNTPLRDITKCGEFIDWRHNGTLVVMVDGGDWGGSWTWEVVMRALAWLGEDLRAAPHRLFSPVILDESGAKLSKTLYVGSDAYGHLPAWIMDPVATQGDEFAVAMSRLWTTVCEWVLEPARFFRNYSLAAII